MRTVIVITGMLLSASASAQTVTVKPIGTWVIEYERTIARMHADPTKFTERGRMTLRAVGDSLFGDFRIGDSASTNVAALRGIVRKDGYTVYVEEPPAKGFGIFFSALGAAMDWLRETVHNVQPVVVRFDLMAKGDSLTGTRNVSGGMGGPRSSAVVGRQTKRL
jgi:hypothetical protein